MLVTNKLELVASSQTAIVASRGAIASSAELNYIRKALGGGGTAVCVAARGNGDAVIGPGFADAVREHTLQFCVQKNRLVALSCDCVAR